MFALLLVVDYVSFYLLLQKIENKFSAVSATHFL